MRQKTEIKILAVFVVLLISLALLVGCAKKIVGHQEIGVRFEIPIEGVISEKLLASIDRFELFVEGEGIPERINSRLTLHNGFVTGEVIVPSGPRRIFTVIAFSKDGVKIYQGVNVVDVFAGHTIVVDIPLIPMVPILTMTPHYQSIQMNDSFYIEVTALNLQNVAIMNFNIMYNYSPFNLYSATLGKDLDTLTWMSVRHSFSFNDTLYCSFTSSNETDDFLSPTGKTHLLTLRFDRYAEWDGDTALTNFRMDVTWLSGANNNGPIPLDSVFTNGAEVLLWQPPFGGQ